MKIVTINGSRRKRGNTARLIEEIVKPSADAGATVKSICLGDYQIEGCTGCEGCAKSWTCVIKDDFQQVVDLLDQADGIVIASPTYWYSVTSDMKCFIDRCYSLIRFPQTRREWIGKYENSGKLCVSAAVCEQHDEAMMGNTLTLLSDFSRDIGLNLVGSLAALECFEMGSLGKNDRILNQAKAVGTSLLSALQEAVPK